MGKIDTKIIEDLVSYKQSQLKNEAKDNLIKMVALYEVVIHTSITLANPSKNSASPFELIDMVAGLKDKEIEGLELRTKLDKANNQLKQLNEDWQPINYEEADSGKECFDGKLYVFKKNNFLFFGAWDNEDKAFRLRKSDLNFVYVDADPTHYRPIPTGWL